MRDAIEADKKAFVLHTEGRAVVPLRINIDNEARDGQIMFMPAYVGGGLNAGRREDSPHASQATERRASRHSRDDGGSRRRYGRRLGDTRRHDADAAAHRPRFPARR